MTEGSISPDQGSVRVADPQEGVVLVSLHGEHDMATSADLDETLRELIESNASNLVADLSQCSFIDATTIQVLLKGAGRAEQQGRAFVLLLAPGSIAERVLEIAGVMTMIPFAHGREEALAKVSNATGRDHAISDESPGSPGDGSD